MLVQETVVQLSRMGVGAGFGDLVEGGVVKTGEEEDGESSEDYDSDVDVAGQSSAVMHVYACMA